VLNCLRALAYAREGSLLSTVAAAELGASDDVEPALVDRALQAQLGRSPMRQPGC
jgi:hypothetical protein